MDRICTSALVGAALLIALAPLAGCGPRERVDLIARLGEAQKAPADAVFSAVDATLGGETARAIAVAPSPSSRLAWRIKVPSRAWLWVSIGMRPEAWDREGDGVSFVAQVADGSETELLFEQHLHPFANPGDRKWFPIRVSLSRYAGRDVDIILSTSAGPNGAGDDQRNDLGLWGVPEIVVR